MNIAQVTGLRVTAAAGPILDGVDLTVHPGEVLGVVGESGSGKTTLGLAMLGACTPGTRISDGSVTVAGGVSYVPQDPVLALNPAMRVGAQIVEIARVRPGAVEDRVARAVRRAGLPTDLLRRWPHQISGGQQQRVLLAQALVNEPRLLVLDEPTTGLDPEAQEALLTRLRRLATETGCGIVHISHNLAAVAAIADRVAVLYAGHIVETGPTADLLTRPRHPYTAALLAAVPSGGVPIGLPGMVPAVGHRPHGCGFAPRCPLSQPSCAAEPPTPVVLTENHTVACPHHTRTATVVRQREARNHKPGPPILTVENLHAMTVVAASFNIGSGECLALTGTSGSGKSTIARCLVGLHRPDAGEIRLGAVRLAATARRRTREQRRAIQFIPQNPADTLDPSRTIAEQVARPAKLLRRLSSRDAQAAALEALDQVRLPAAAAIRRPGELSGGERQRAAIARALIAQPEVLICDEITSALDVSVQAAVLELLDDLRAETGMALLFISHDHDVVATLADRIATLPAATITEAKPLHDRQG